MENKNFAFQTSNILIKLASEKEEYDQIWKLRYFDLILNYNQNQVNEEEVDKDIYDDVCDHLIAIDTFTNKVVGTYRLIKKSHLKDIKTFLTETEFDLSNLKQYEILEVGRAVVKEEYRSSSIISLFNYFTWILCNKIFPTAIRFGCLWTTHLQIMTISSRQSIGCIQKRAGHVIVHLQNTFQHIGYLFLTCLSVTGYRHFDLQRSIFSYGDVSFQGSRHGHSLCPTQL